MKKPAVYIMASKKNGTIYTGVTSDLAKRVYDHKLGLVKGFAAKYQCTNLVFYEYADTMDAAIRREKNIKLWRREKKLVLIESVNLDWDDLYGLDI